MAGRVRALHFVRPSSHLSDLADGAMGGKGENEIETFFKLAADNSAKVLMAYLVAWK